MAAENVIAFLTEMGMGNRYAHADKHVDPVTVRDTATNVKILCFLARNVEEKSTAYCDTVECPSFVTSLVSCEERAETTGDEHARKTDFLAIFVIEEDRGEEHSLSKTVAKAAGNTEDVTLYTNIHGISYLEVTTIENALNV